MITNTSQVSASRIAALIVGKPGIGKTSLAKTLPEKETLIISMEAGLLCLAGTKIDVAETSDRKMLDKVLAFLATPEGKKKYKYIFIDSLTELSEIFYQEKLAKYPKDGRKVYGECGELTLTYIRHFRDMTDYSVFITCIDKIKELGLEKVETYNLRGNMAADNMPGLFDLILHYQTFKDAEGKSHRMLVTDIEEAPLSKDRSGLLKKYEEPHLGKILTKLGVKS